MQHSSVHGAQTVNAQEQPEQIAVRFRRHGRVLVLPTIALFLASCLGGFFVGSFDKAIFNILTLVGVLLLAICGFCGPFFAWLAGRTTVTTRRIIVRSGVFTRSRSEVSINRMRSVSTQRGLGQRLVGSGDIILGVAGSEEPLVLHDVPGVKAIAEVVQQLVQSSYAADLRSQTGFYTRSPQDPYN